MDSHDVPPVANGAAEQLHRLVDRLGKVVLVAAAVRPYKRLLLRGGAVDQRVVVLLLLLALVAHAFPGLAVALPLTLHLPHALAVSAHLVQVANGIAAAADRRRGRR